MFGRISVGLRLWKWWRKLMSEIKTADADGFKWGINLKKAGKGFLADALKVAGIALAGLILDPASWQRWLDGNVPPGVLLALLPFIGMFTESGRNFLKHKLGWPLVLLLALSLPAAAQDGATSANERGVPGGVARTLVYGYAPEQRNIVCKDGYVYEEACREIDGETFCTLRPVEDLKRGLAVRGCSDMTVLGTVAMLTAVHGSDLWTTSHGLRGGESAGGELVEANPLGQSVEKRIALKLAAIGAGTLAIHTLAKKDPKAARKLRAATVAALAVIAGRNMWLALKDAEKGGAVPVAVSVGW